MGESITSIMAASLLFCLSDRISFPIKIIWSGIMRMFTSGKGK